MVVVFRNNSFTNESNIYFVSYEDLCSKNNAILKTILNSIGIEFDSQNLLINKNSGLQEFKENDLVQEANKIYENLREMSFK